MISWELRLRGRVFMSTCVCVSFGGHITDRIPLQTDIQTDTTTEDVYINTSHTAHPTAKNMPPSTQILLANLTIILLQQAVFPFILQQPSHNKRTVRRDTTIVLRTSTSHGDDTESSSSSSPSNIFAPITPIVHDINDHNNILQRIVNFGTSFGSHKARLEGRWLRTLEDVQTKQGVLSYLQAVHGLTLQGAEALYGRNEELVIDRVYHEESQEVNVVLGEFHFSDDIVGAFSTNANQNQNQNHEETAATINCDTTSSFSSWKSVNGKRVHISTREVTTANCGTEKIERSLITMPNVCAADEECLLVRRSYTPVSDDDDTSKTQIRIEGMCNDKGGVIVCTEVFRRVRSSTKQTLVSPLTRVPGCVATVDLRTTLIPLANNDDENKTSNTEYAVRVDGSADARLSRGLLAIVSASLGDDCDVARAFGRNDLPSKGSNVPTANEIISIDSERVADELGLRGTLSVGRNDGLASMMRVVQNHIRTLFLDEDDEEVSSTSSSKLTEINPSSPLSSNSNTGECEQVAMLLSGGVDSSVALNLLKQKGYKVRAFYLKIWLEDELSHLGQCPWEDDWEMCQKVCAQAGVPLEAVSLQEQYKQKVISYTVAEASKGRTPNPDIMCNSMVKFGCFYDAIAGRDFEYIASGHYARLVTDDDGTKRLTRAPDDVKDQSYFLSALTQKQLERVLFPIGDYTKVEVRELAQQFDLPNKSRPDSQGLCFLGKVKFDDFLGAYLGEKPGNIVDAKSGDVIGRHRGLWFHTVGQVRVFFITEVKILLLYVLCSVI